MTSISDTNVVNAPGGLVEVARVTRTNGSSGINITATSVASASDFFSTPATFIADGSPYVVEVFIPLYYAMNGANYSSRLSLVSGSTEITRLTTQDTAVVFTGSSQFAKYIVTPSPGVVSYNVRAWVTANNSYIFCGNAGSDYPPAFLRVSKIIQASQLIVQTPNAPLVTSLPSNAIDGQEVRYLVDNTNGIVWNFRYRAGSSSSYKWEFIGGPPLRSTGAGSSTNSTTPQTTNTPSITVPLAGDYDCSYGGFTQNTSYGVVYNSTIWLYKDTTSLESVTFVPVSTYNGASIAGAYRATNLTVSQVLNLRYAVSTTSSTSSFGTMFINTTPIRVSA